MKTVRKYYICLLCLIALAGCAAIGQGAGKTQGTGSTAERLVVYCPHPFGLINPIVSEFENQTGIPVEVVTGGTGGLLDRVAAKEQPECDVFWGGSLTSVKPRAELFEDYISANEDMVREEFRNAEGCLTRFTDLPSVLMVNENLQGDISIEGYQDLLDPRLKGKIAMCSPSSSSSAWEHLINMLYAMGDGEPEEGWDYVGQFVANLDGVLLQSSSAVYQGVADGSFVVGLTFEEPAAHYVSVGTPIRIVYMKEGVISRPDVVGIVRGTCHREEAEQFVDFITGKDAQTVITASLDRRTVRSDVKGAEYLPDKEDIHIIYDDEVLTGQKKAQWLERFRELYEQSAPSGQFGGEAGDEAP